MALLSCDVVVLGSSLGGLIAAGYLSRLGLRVIVIEEEAQAKRPALLREPLLLSGLRSGGPLRAVFRELSLPLREQAELEPEASALRLVLPQGEFELGADRERCADALAAAAGLDRAEVTAWLARSQASAARTRAALWRREPSGLWGWWPRREAAELRAALRVPGALAPILETLLGALHPLPPVPDSAAAQLGLAAVLSGSQRMPAGSAFLDLLRRRVRARHGEIHTADVFGLASHGAELEIALPRGAFRTRALVIASPLEPLRAVLEETGGVPEWWKPAPEPLRCPQRLFRIEADYAPEDGAQRVIAGGPSETDQLWFSRHPDTGEGGAQWLLAAGPGASAISPVNPLGRHTPFPRNSVVPCETGPEPRWDLAASELRLRLSPRIAAPRRLALAQVGPERAGLLGFEGELLQARRAALALAARLGARRLP